MKTIDKARLGWTLIVMAAVVAGSLVMYDIYFYHYVVGVSISITGLGEHVWYVAEFSDRVGGHQWVFSTNLFRALSAVKRIY